MRHPLPNLLLLAAAALPCGAVDRTAGSPFTTVAELRAQRDLSPNAGCPLSLSGVVTLADESRNLLVLQDATGAVALHPDPPGISVRPGQRISLTAAASAPYVASCPGYPFRPLGRDIQATFEAPANEGDHRLNRMRGWLRPTVTGDHTFWIASDDSSELWLSTGSNPLEARRVAMVAAGQWTGEKEWNRYPSQRSEKVFLRAGESYYIEALHDQLLHGSHLAVAWEGPDQERAVIGAEHLVPWDTATGDLPAAENPDPPRGILREFWADYSAARVLPLTSGSWADGELAVSGMEISILGDGEFPEARPLGPGQALQPFDTFRWMEGDGAVEFLASDGTSATLELAVGGRRLLVRVARWQGPLPSPGPGLRAKFKGVCEGGRNSNGNLIVGVVWSPSGQEISFHEDPDPPPRDSAENPAVPDFPESAMGGAYFTRGVVTFNDHVLGKDCLFVQETFGGVFISQHDRRLQPMPRIGQSVEISGNLLSRKHAPAMWPRMLNILGRVSLPAPVVPPVEAPTSAYRDGQWSQIDGVARSVNDDGTVTLMGKTVPLRIWIGESDRSDLERLVNSVLRVRGVMTIETFDSPLLLVPSRGFVEIRNPAPVLPEHPVPVASLSHAESKAGWVHQAKVAGIVTYRSQRHFLLQDPSGALRVRPRATPCPTIGSAVEVVGFPGSEGDLTGMTEASCMPLDAGPPSRPEPLELKNLDPKHNGTLVTIEARLLSRKSRAGDHLLELQADQQVFEALLEAPAGGLPEIAAGSLLAVTGICMLDPASPSLALQHLLLRSPLDVTLLQGGPWWTWQRTALLIGTLLAVLAGTSSRILLLNRRFSRQQEARLAFARGILESQESERRRIAASLHDSLGQNLLVIRNQTHMAIQSAEQEPALRQRLEEISNTTLHAINEVREITHNLRPYQLDRLGLTQAIRALTRKVSENCRVVFACHIDEIDGIFDNESEIHIYRIVQEGINNVLKHSEATEATVVIKAAPDILSISIRDNGRGLAEGGATSAAGFGLSGIRERAEIMGGTARVVSTPGQGCNLQVQFPLQAARK